MEDEQWHDTHNKVVDSLSNEVKTWKPRKYAKNKKKMYWHCQSDKLWAEIVFALFRNPSP